MTTGTQLTEELRLVFKTWAPIGNPLLGGDYSKQRIKCNLSDKPEVTLTAQTSGVVVCSEWRKCKHHMEGGYSPCPVLVSESILKNMRSTNPKAKGFKFLAPRGALS